MRLELREGTSSKFWEIERVDTELRIRWGRIGTVGQGQTKSFATEDDAERELEKLVAAKRRGGYAPAVGTGTDPAPAAPSGPQKRPSPTRATPARAVRRFTFARGAVVDDSHTFDVDGRNVLRRARGPMELPDDASLEKFIAHLVDEARRAGLSPRPEVSVDLVAERVEALAARQAERLKDTVRVGADGVVTLRFERGVAPSWPEVGRALAAAAPRSVRLEWRLDAERLEAAELRAILPPSIESFVFDSGDTAERQYENDCGELYDLVASMPRLRRVFLVGRIACTRRVETSLEELVLIHRARPAPFVDELGASRFASLRHLSLDLRSDRREHAIDAALARALARLDAPLLETVDLDSVSDVNVVLETLLETGLPPHWTSLAVNGTRYDEDRLIETVRRHSGALAPLARLALPLEPADLAGVVRAAKPTRDPFLPGRVTRW